MNPKPKNKNPKHRSRLVATEVRKPWSEKWFAATPPIEALRILVSLAARGNTKTKRPRRMLLLDVSRAHWHPEAKRDVHVRLLPEDPQAETDTFHGFPSVLTLPGQTRTSACRPSDREDRIRP